MKSRLESEGRSQAPRERLMDAAIKLFYQKGIRSVGVEAIAEAAHTTKMALYRHFKSKDELVSAWLERLSTESDRRWQQIADENPGDPQRQLTRWVALIAHRMGQEDERGCPFANTIAEIAEKDHPARRVIADHKQRQHSRLIALGRALGASDPLKLADLILYTVEGARLCAQYFNDVGIAQRLPSMIDEILSRFQDKDR